MQGSLEDAEEATNEEAFAAWYSYWRGMFPAVTTEDIESFEVSLGVENKTVTFGQRTAV